ncbi:MAG: hypothetical protein II453_09885 [Alphaproteobacteria bacterium]|nr:hypothetical protein [Alphaproteobacteria bacterium]MBQ3946370.1 hypothetical protein [Alphaproteobacteria bacterium]
MPENFNQLTSKTSLLNAFEALKDNINYNLNCVKIATVEQFFSDNLTVSCRVANKRVLGIKEDGNQILQDYPLIYAKVHYLGWGSVGATFPITQGMEGILLFNDREIETWFLTGAGGNLAYDRCHNMSDAIFICGLHSLPNMIQILLDCFHLYYGNSDIQIKDASIEHTSTTHTFNGNMVINGNLQVNGSINATGDIVAAGISLINHIHSGVEPGNGKTGAPE